MNITDYHATSPLVLLRNYHFTLADSQTLHLSPYIVTYHRPTNLHSSIRPSNPQPYLSTKAAEILRSVYACRLMSARQIERLYFNNNNSPLTAARICRRTLKSLAEQDILRRRQRRVGGIRAGSASYIYSIGPVGARLVSDRRVHYYIQDPSDYFIEHTLALAELYVQLHEQSRKGHFKILEIHTEPKCWRSYITLATGKQSLRPDMYVRLSVGNDELSYFIEMDRGTTFAPSLLKKLHTYEDYYMSANEQRDQGVFPQVLWIVPNSKRQIMLTELCRPMNERIPGICKVTVSAYGITSMLGTEPP